MVRCTSLPRPQAGDGSFPDMGETCSPAFRGHVHRLEKTMIELQAKAVHETRSEFQRAMNGAHR